MIPKRERGSFEQAVVCGVTGYTMLTPCYCSSSPYATFLQEYRPYSWLFLHRCQSTNICNLQLKTDGFDPAKRHSCLFNIWKWYWSEPLLAGKGWWWAAYHLNWKSNQGLYIYLHWVTSVCTLKKHIILWCCLMATGSCLLNSATILITFELWHATTMSAVLTRTQTVHGCPTLMQWQGGIWNASLLWSIFYALT